MVISHKATGILIFKVTDTVLGSLPLPPLAAWGLRKIRFIFAAALVFEEACYSAGGDCYLT
jgi:hypothetical protein